MRISGNAYSLSVSGAGICTTSSCLLVEWGSTSCSLMKKGLDMQTLGTVTLEHRSDELEVFSFGNLGFAILILS